MSNSIFIFYPNNAIVKRLSGTMVLEFSRTNSDIDNKLIKRDTNCDKTSSVRQSADKIKATFGLGRKQTRLGRNKTVLLIKIMNNNNKFKDIKKSLRISALPTSD